MQGGQGCAVFLEWVTGCGGRSAQRQALVTHWGRGGGVAREEEAATSFSQCVSGRITVPLGPLNGAEEEAEVRVPSPVSQGAGSGVCRQ